MRGKRDANGLTRAQAAFVARGGMRRKPKTGSDGHKRRVCAAKALDERAGLSAETLANLALLHAYFADIKSHSQG